MQPLCPSLYRLPGLIVGNVYLIVDDDGLTLIDTSIAPSGRKILQHVAALGYAMTDIKRVLITHAHPDHVGGLPTIKQATGAEIWASARERPVIEGKIPIPRVPPDKRAGLARFVVLPEVRLPCTEVDCELHDGEILTGVLGGLQVISTPGHAPGHIAFWQPERRILFCGDVIFRLPNLRLPFSFLTVDSEQNKRSIRRVAELDAEVVCFGHGRPLQQHTAQVIRSFAHRVGVL